MDAAAFEQVYQDFQEFHAYFAGLFGRQETRERSGHYLQALLVQSGERRNAENLSETVPESARGMQRFLTDSPWDDDAVIGRLQEYLAPRLEHSEAVWVLDGSDFPKQGRKSAGVARQYCGRLGKVANCQAGMFLAYVSPLGRALVDKGLYLPESWTSDPQRCAAAGVPEERRGYKSKTGLALEMSERAIELGHLQARWVAADDAFGMSPSFREGLADLGMRYVLDVPSGFTVWPPDPQRTSPVYQGRGAPRKPRLVRGQRRTIAGAQRRVAGGGLAGDHGSPGEPGAPQLPVQCAKGAAHQQTKARRDSLGRLPAEPGRQRAPLLPVQRSGGHNFGDPGIRGGGSRWRIETEFETEKGDVGLDEYETRSWAGWQHHIAMCFLGGAFLLSLQQAWGKKDAPGQQAAGVPGGARDAAPGAVRAGGVAAVAGGGAVAQPSGQPLSRQTPRRPPGVSEHPSVNCRCNTKPKPR